MGTRAWLKFESCDRAQLKDAPDWGRNADDRQRRATALQPA
jgi:hypothetical protein